MPLTALPQSAQETLTPPLRLGPNVPFSEKMSLSSQTGWGTPSSASCNMPSSNTWWVLFVSHLLQTRDGPRNGAMCWTACSQHLINEWINIWKKWRKFSFKKLICLSMRGTDNSKAEYKVLSTFTEERMKHFGCLEEKTMSYLRTHLLSEVEERRRNVEGWLTFRSQRQRLAPCQW